MPAKYELFADSLLGSTTDSTFVDYSQVTSMEDEFTVSNVDNIDDEADLEMDNTGENDEMNEDVVKQKIILKKLRAQQIQVLSELATQVESLQADE